MITFVRKAYDTSLYISWLGILMLKEINKLIAERVGYGVRDIRPTSDDFVFLSWSNGSADWYMNTFISPNSDGTYRLDANEIMVPYSKKEVEILLEEKKLDNLPLYSNSTEVTKPFKHME